MFLELSSKTDGGPTVRSCKTGYGFCFVVPHVSIQNGHIVGAPCTLKENNYLQ